MENCEQLLSVFSTSKYAEICWSLDINDPICELAELKVHWAQPWNKHDYVNVTQVNKVLKSS